MAYLCFSQTKRGGQVFALLTDDVMIFAECFFKLQQLRRRESRPDAFWLTEWKKQSRRTIGAKHCLHRKYRILYRIVNYRKS